MNLAPTGNGRNPMALVRACGMSRENKVEFSGMRRTHGIQLHRKPPWQVTFVTEELCPQCPTEVSTKGHLAKVQAPGCLSHSGTPPTATVWGKQPRILRGGPPQQDRRDLAGEGLQLPLPGPRAASLAVILRVGTGKPTFSLQQSPLQA